jgi:two-component system C4-dicarboxylate transport response regulator DctD
VKNRQKKGREANTVLLVEDDKPLRRSIAQIFELEELNVIEAGTVIEAEDHISTTFGGVVLSDIRLPGKDGFDLLAHARKTDADLPVILLTGAGDIPMAVRAMNQGASEFLEKPCHPDELVKKIRHWLKARSLVLENRRLERLLLERDEARRLFPGNSEVIREFRTRLRKYAELPAHLHFDGQEGAGKTIACQAVHDLSGASGEFVILEANEISEEMLASKLEQAERGTLVLRNVERANRATQELMAKIITRSDGVRTLSTSITSLPDLENEGFSRALYFALKVLHLRVPSLIERKEDLPEIFNLVSAEYSEKLNRQVKPLDGEQRAKLLSAKWSGNLPELRAYAQRHALGLEAGLKEEGGHKPGLADQITAFEKMTIMEALHQCQGKTDLAAKQLEVPVQTLYDKLKKHGLKASEFRQRQT